jgi:ElaA protein
MDISWSLKPFYELTTQELYELLHLRSEVFVVEQACAFQDMDHKDQRCYHLLGWAAAEGYLAAYTRLVPPGVAYEEAAIGRVVTSPRVRRAGVGRVLMQKSIAAARELYGPGPIRIGAQLYLRSFYESLGFRPCSELYLEDGIEHIEMLLPAQLV